MIRVLVAEDSAVTREYLVYLLGRDPGLEVAGAARDGQEALDEAKRLRPDVILMDVHMPRMNGYEATRRIMEEAPVPIVMVSASLSMDETAMTFQALQAGALTVAEKPPGLDHPDHAAVARRLVETVKSMAEVKVVRRWPRRERPALPPRPARPSSRKVQLIAIGASTGGPAALSEILRNLPGDLGVPVLVVQHIAAGFVPGLTEWLEKQTPLTVKLAEAEETARPGVVYVAPDGWQMGVTKDFRIRLTKAPSLNGFCPSVDYLFRSVAEFHGHSAIGVLLTGMGRDGAEGLLHLRQAGGVSIVQDEESSVVFGMPGEAVRIGAAEFVLAPEEIAGAIRSITMRE
ncbi:MAG: chemotaxis response regulator protein-glutamate methylesterase [Candidatus Tectomicrobia bacterium RIFCSPLOWO2_12_FULL_69_37]|nr:MAG: chemotaxis response regulator protein-glutamate methylesterase [Candidatus Tectomicrobia bacterium RIFCSPLOWO2_02_FULL_70_19]OGL67361.1 MAG: chemotaxis response regulator protein-glutamate methylesterase [Candidatus Tectomicrobia bacterium RIFCSPLOWO2_12_FULL_69_37]